jgi:hypothetical protein
MRRFLSMLLVLASVAGANLRLAAQDSNIVLPIEVIERRLTLDPFEIRDRQGTRFEGDRTQRVILVFADSNAMMVKWGRAARGGQAFNNQPRYEVAAYQLQKLFLDERDYVVPPTLLRMVPVNWYREFDDKVIPTFDRTNAVLVALQYWLSSVTQRDVYDAKRFDSDSLYARHFANLNVLTYLIRHGDSNAGNVLISSDSANPRLFAVDNGVAFAPPDSDRGTEWRDLKVRRLPRGTVERLRAISREDLDRMLGVVAQFEVRDGEMVPVQPGASLGGRSGVRRRGDVIQLGLTSTEIRGVHSRLQQLLKQVDSGRIVVF